MSGTMTLLQLGGYVGLLLWGTHMVSTGIERGFGAELRRWLGRTLSRPGGRARLYAFLAGLAVTAVLQSSTATGLMATSFTASGAIDLAPALAVMLGANVGSTLITQILAFNIAEVAPVLVLIGVVLFRSSSDGRRQKSRPGRHRPRADAARARRARSHTLEPVETAPALRAVLGSLGGEPVLAVLIAAALTWACHSSVAVVLLIASLAGIGCRRAGGIVGSRARRQSRQHLAAALRGRLVHRAPASARQSPGTRGGLHRRVAVPSGRLPGCSHKSSRLRPAWWSISTPPSTWRLRCCSCP